MNNNRTSSCIALTPKKPDAYFDRAFQYD